MEGGSALASSAERHAVLAVGVIVGAVALDDGELRKGAACASRWSSRSRGCACANVRRACFCAGHIFSIADERRRWRTEARLSEFLDRIKSIRRYRAAASAAS